MGVIDEPEVGREELGGARQHQLVALLDRDVRHARDVRDLALSPLVIAFLKVSERLSRGKRSMLCILETDCNNNFSDLSPRT